MSHRVNIFVIFLIAVSSLEASRIKRSALDNTVSTTIPSSFDYRDHGKVTPVKNQGACGSAYTFAAVGAIESQYLLRKNQSLDLSEQFLLNCDFYSSLCYSEDKTTTIFDYAKTEGIPLETCLPYTSGIAGNVDFDQCDVCPTQRYKVAGWRQYGVTASKTFSEDKIAEDLYNYGPATVAMYFPHRKDVTGGDHYDNVNYLIVNYAGGIFDWTPTNVNCSSMYVFLLIGYTPDYWIAKASLGPNWGENGYIRFKRGSNMYSFSRAVFAPYIEDVITTIAAAPTTTTPTTTAAAPTTTAASATTTIPSSFDYREHAKVTPAKNQGACGSAYTFAAVGAIESQYLLRKNQSLDLSEQLLLNCDFYSSLCYSEDKTTTIFDYAKTEGIPLETCLPYTSGIAGNVDFDKCDVCPTQRYKVAGWRQYGVTSTKIPKTFSEDKIAEDLYNYGPATVAMYFPHRKDASGGDHYDNVNYLIANYAGGIFDWTPTTINCTSMYVFLLVGYTPDYWIAKASLGPNWGENGYIRFKRGTNIYSFSRAVYAPYLEDSVEPTTTEATPTGWTEWAATSCTANCGLCGRTIMSRTCLGSEPCVGESTMNSTTPCGSSAVCAFPLSSCCAPAKRVIVNKAMSCA